MRDLWTKNYKDVRIVQKGTKIIKVDVANVRYLDSLSIFQMSLAKTAKSFRDKKDRIKGTFPHLANTEEFYDYDGVILDKKWYATEYFTETDRIEFHRWHNEQVSKGTRFKFMEELKKYCENDVEILLFSVMQFRKLFKEITGIDPITRKFTLASIGQEYFRSSIMKENTIGIVPTGGYLPIPGKGSSVPESAWLDDIEREKGIILERQYQIGPYTVDGFHPESMTVFEFLGIFYSPQFSAILITLKYRLLPSRLL